MSDTQQLRSYVLGTLAEERTEDLEARLLVDDALSEALELVEDELVEAYVRNTLDPAERALFEARLATKPLLAESVHYAGIVRERMLRDAPPARVSGRLAALLATAAILVLGVGLALRQLRPQPAPPIRSEGPAIASPQPGTPSPFQGMTRETPVPRRIAALSLSPGRTMTAAATPTVSLAAGIDLLRVELAVEDALAEAYTVQLWSDKGALLWRKDRVRPTRDAVVVEVPATTLAPGEYRLDLSPSGSDPDDAIPYYFAMR
jgi:hypothetical protein